MRGGKVTGMAERKWFIGKVDAGAEFTVAKRLRRLSVRVKCPAYTVTKRRAGQRRPRKVPLVFYKGYLFLDRASVMDLERVCIGTKGFQCIVSLDGTNYSSCDDTALREAVLYARSLDYAGMLAPSTPEALTHQMLMGAFVKVSGGAAGGRYGTIEELKDGRAKLDGADFPKATWVPVHRLVLQNVAK